MKNPRSLAMLVLALVGAALVASVPLRSENPKPEEPKKLTGTEIADKLESRFNFPGWDDPKTTVHDALDQLTKRTGVAIEINTRAFADADVADVDKYEFVASKPFPAMKVSLSRLLRKFLDRLPTNSRALWVIREDAIELTTARAFTDEIGRGGNDPMEGGTTPTVPLVYASLEKQPLEQALKTLASRAAFSVILDARVGDKAKTPVTAALKNVPLDTAVRLLADMADLRSVLIDNTLYVTSPENADRLEAEQTRRRIGVFGEVPGGFGFQGGIGILGGNPPKPPQPGM